MNEDDIRRIFSEELTKASKERPPVECSLGLDREAHTKEHQFIGSLMAMSERLDNIKWGFIGAATKTLGYIVIGIIFLGVVTWARVELKKFSG